MARMSCQWKLVDGWALNLTLGEAYKDELWSWLQCVGGGGLFVYLCVLFCVLSSLCSECLFFSWANLGSSQRGNGTQGHSH